MAVGIVMSRIAKRVARRFTAELLTKQWLMGIRRGWLQFMKPSISDYDDVLRAYDQLERFGERLKEQVTFIRQGGAKRLLDRKHDAKLEKAFFRLGAATRDSKGQALHWKEYIDGTAASLQWGEDRTEDAKKMLALYKSDFAGASHRSVKLRGNRWKAVGLTHFMDVILKLLRADALVIQKHDEAHPGGKFNAPTAAFSEFAIGNMKLVAVDPKFNGAAVDRYVKLAIRAKKALESKGLGKVWMGLTLLKSGDYRQLNEMEKRRYEDAGYDGLTSSAGMFYQGKNLVELTGPPDDQMLKTLIHELGHRYWYKNMGQEQRAKFENVVQTRAGPKGGSKKRLVAKVQAHTSRLVALFHTLGLSDVAKRDAAREELRDEEMPAGIGVWEFYMVGWRDPNSAPALRSRYTNTMRLIPPVFDHMDHLGASGGGWEEKTQPQWVKYSRKGKTLAQRMGDAILRYIEVVPGDVEPVSDYGGTKPNEAFAEAFAWYVLERSMTRPQIESLRAVMAYRVDPSDVVERVVQDGVGSFAR